MRDYLLDIVQHTHALGFIDLVKITGTDSVTSIEAISEERIAIVQAQFHNPIPEFIGCSTLSSGLGLSIAEDGGGSVR